MKVQIIVPTDDETLLAMPLSGRSGCISYVCNWRSLNTSSQLCSTELLLRICVQISNLCSETVVVFEVASNGRRNILG